MYVPSSSNELPCKKAASYQQLKMPVTGCHSALDAESRFSFFWIPAFARMTIL
jgi:hypothetical protein